MAHFAELDANNIVLRTIVVHNNELLVDGVESEDKGIAFCKSLFGEDTRWKQTSYNETFRKNYAGPGYYYDDVRDAFIPQCKFVSFRFNEQTCKWEAPVPYPQDGKAYNWDEATISWVEITQ